MSETGYLTQLSRTALLYILAVLVTSIGLMYKNIAGWITIVALVCVVWRLFIFSGKLSFPPSWLKGLLVFFSMIGAFFQYRYSLSLDVFVSILMLGFSLRLLEVYHKQAAQMLLYLAIFVLMTYLLYEQTLVAGIFTLCQMLLIVAALIAVNSNADSLNQYFFQPVKKASLVLLIALPLMTAIFLFMPRLNPLWNMPLQAQQAKTGMSEQMSPGDITHLINSPDLVFRATFTGSIPPRNELYWQAFVFDEFDGRQWKNNCECNYTWINTTKVSLPESSQMSLWQYQIMLEPHGNHWLFALPNTYIQDDRIRTNGDNLFRARREVVDKMAYEARVFSKLNTQVLSAADINRYKKLPKLCNPQARKLAEMWRLQYTQDKEIVDKALNLYRDSMRYTLTPPALGADSIDDFLFVTKAGFCEHYASSFVFLMRAAGIPARVILGYQGGEINTQNNYVVVRQYDAHAWAEVWLSGRGWVKIDPTAAVNPERIEVGFDAVFANSAALNSPLNLNAYRNINMLNLLRLKLDYMDYAWSRWVVGYNANLQNNLLARLGLTSPLRMVMWIVMLSVICFAMFIVFLWMGDRREQYEHPLTSRYRKLISAYERLGVRRSLSETPLQFSESVHSKRLLYSHEFNEVSLKYNEWFCCNQKNSQFERALKYQCLYLQIRLTIASIIKF
jgi:transglutaminase-like putative cysteine protease